MFYQTTCVKVYDGYITIRVYLVWYIIIVTLIINTYLYYYKVIFYDDKEYYR